MKTKLPWLLLALVMAFSASYVVGFRHAPSERMGEAEQIELVAHKLGLDERQRTAYAHFRREMTTLEGQRQAAQLERMKAMRERLLQPDSAPRNGAQVADEAAQAQRDFMKASAARMRELMAELRPEQREKFFDLLIQAQTERIQRVQQPTQ